MGLASHESVTGLLDAKSMRSRPTGYAHTDDLEAVIIINLDALGSQCDHGGRVGAGDDRRSQLAPLRLSCQPVAKATDLDRLAQVSDETDVSSTDEGFPEADQAAEIEAAMAEARARLAEVPAEVVVTNHVMGLYELAAIHLSSSTPDLVSASLAIDSMAMLVEGLGDRLGDDAPTMQDALANLRMAFVGIKAQANEPSSDEA